MKSLKEVKAVLFSDDDLQDILSFINNNEDYKKSFIKEFKKEYPNDFNALLSVLEEGWYEEFYRFDSSVAEEFVRVYQKLNVEIIPDK